jgi:hypothetical protein
VNGRTGLGVLGALLLGLALLPARAGAVVESSGVAPSGAAWRIALPDAWRAGDGLVLVQHGYRYERDAEPDLGPLRERMLADGYAIAASGYRQAGWAVGRAFDDNAELLEIFRSRHGAPGHLVAAGASMGGLIALRLAEDPRFRAQTEGVLAFCPVTDGLKSWEHAFDLRLAYDALCAGVDRGQLPRGAEPTPWALDLADLPVQAPDPDDPALLLGVAAPIAACTGLGVPAALRSAGMQQRLAALQEVAGTQDEAGLQQRLGYAIFGLSELVRAPDKLAGVVPFDSLDVRFDSNATPPNPLFAALNTQLHRVDADGLQRLRFEDHNRLDGSATARIVSLHTRRDPLVAPAQQIEAWFRYAAEPARRRALVALADEATPTHCGFTPAELASGWELLQTWRTRPVVPAPDAGELQAACLEIDHASCRWRATSVQELAASLPQAHYRRWPDLAAPLSGLWYDPTRSGQGWMLEELDLPFGAEPIGPQRIALSGYTWAPGPPAERGARWLIGVGRLRDSGFVVDDVLQARSGGFGDPPSPVTLQLEPWGRIEVAHERDGTHLFHAGPPGWGSGVRRLAQLTASGYAVPWGIDFSPAPAPLFHRLGTYYSRRHPGQGWVLNQFQRAGRVASVLLWYTFDLQGRPMWLVGDDADAADGLRFAMRWSNAEGRFDAPLPAPLPPWGEVELETDACHVTAVAWRADEPGYGSGRIALERLTDPYEYTRYHSDCR